ncbi:hypothetical protein FB451DRAFT_1549774 [Mycena latifolia]|nr:hypothetical protein FB451DRAFT_1549774 [Mycena latifolia]
MPSGFDSTLGAFEVGVMISYVLFGFTTLQTYIYFSRFPNDRRPLKYLVAFVWCCEMAHVVCVGAALYTMTITYFGQVERLIRTPDSLTAGITFSGLVGPSVQSFFAFRIYRLSESWWIPCVCWGLSFTRVVGAIAASVEGIKMVTLEQFETQWGWLAATIWGIGAVNDLIIAGALAYLFSRQRSELLPKRLHFFLDRKDLELIVWTIETGAVTSIAGVATLICFLVDRDNFAWLAWYICTTRLFSNALLASLNSRATLRAISDGGITMDNVNLTSNRSRSIAFAGRPTHKSCEVEVTSEVSVV